MELRESLKVASQEANLKHLREVRDHYIEYHRALYSSAALYDNAVILAGYAAFFALWAGTAGDVPSVARLLTVGLMGVSLMAYIAVVVSQMLVRQKMEFSRSEAFLHVGDPQRFIEIWDKSGQAYERRQGFCLRYWLPGFWLALASGFAAAIILTYNALAAAFGFPVLTG